MSTNRLFKLAERFARKISLADKLPMPAQPGDIQDALEAANLWGTPDVLFPSADAAGLDPAAPVAVTIVVDASLNVSFRVTAGAPGTPAQALKMAGDLKQKFGESFKAAIQNHFQKYKIIPRPVSAGWHKLVPPGSK